MTQFRRITAALLIVSITALGLPQLSYAGMLATGAIVAAPDRDRIATFLDRAEVQGQLKAYGVSVADVKGRLAALTDEEVAQLAHRIDQLPTGGDGFAALVGAAVLIFLVLLITDLAGLTHVFPFVKHPDGK